MHFQVYVDPPGFSCPGVPVVPIISVFFNMLLFAQVCIALHFALFARILGFKFVMENRAHAMVAPCCQKKIR
jgi:hypothetical protein